MVSAKTNLKHTVSKLSFEVCLFETENKQQTPNFSSRKLKAQVFPLKRKVTSDFGEP